MLITLAEAKEHLRVEHIEEDGYITGLINAATGYAERRTGLVLEPREESFAFDCFGRELVLPLGPVNVATLEVAYFDASNAQQGLVAPDYRAVTHRRLTRLLPPLGGRWPAAQSGTAIVNVTATVGFAAGECPATIQAAVKLIVGHWYVTREAVNIGNIVNRIPLSADDLLDSERLIPVSFA